MARISSETLFNFTDSIDYLIDNLTEGIYCHNTEEKLPFGKNKYRAPMACFCDIPLSLIKEHFDWYGRYGIGLKRSYARELGVKPVWYVTSENPMVRNLVKQKSHTENELRNLIPYLKQFIGYQRYSLEGRDKRKKFYDEREWRYIAAPGQVEIFFGQKAIRSMSQAIQKNERMKLDLNAIEYIIIDKSADVKTLLPVLKKIATTTVSFETLVSKIITATQIERDF
ncbi:MAG: hypothetical protein LBV74_06920 [Tannerella sp.]|jgi:hypothetical protein|nr:hypothetical protein [Tannerella sp.]